jgi:diadenosine tetraphosphate (Ap4A) HIT family hydrolase
MSMPGIHPQLLADCHYLGQLATSGLLLHRNATVPWFILVPDTELHDYLDLPQEHREAVLADCVLVSQFIKQVLGFEKVNFAGLGNVVPQMHLHIIGRAGVDPCWPQPVWGNLIESEPYELAQLQAWQQVLVKMAALKPAAL